MLDTITTITTSVTAIFSVCIAYKSFKETENRNKLERLERSTKAMRLFRRETRSLTQIIWALSLGSKSVTEQFGFKVIQEPIALYKTITSNNAEEHLKNYIGKTEEIIASRLDDLSLEDEETLSISIERARKLLVETERLKRAVENKESEKQIEKHSDNIAEIADEIMKSIK
ncbi:hypothetical protein [Salinicoccus roseus]|uniref:hypothetical protein n=1 Tax=Salinicoccus roseus TaxID=45670 RepID=UPI0023010E2E|nr:hypothetical protein [Salinicoccus roseus]